MEPQSIETKCKQFENINENNKDDYKIIWKFISLFFLGSLEISIVKTRKGEKH